MGYEQELVHDQSNQHDISLLVQPVNRLKMNSQSNSEPDYKFEDVRLATFQQNGNGWPSNDKVEARKVARAGLYYTGQYTEAKCPWCQIVITNWDYGDQAMAKHRLVATQTGNDCPFVMGTSDNVPLLRMTPSPTPHTSRHEVVTDQTGRVEFCPNYLMESERLRSFETSPRWPLSYILPADLARSGFFYLKQQDMVKCAFCHIMIGHWTEEDYPDTEHRSLSPNCPFMLNEDVGNVPIDTPATYNSTFGTTTTSRDFFSIEPESLESFDVTGVRAPTVNGGPEKGPQVLRLIKVNGAPESAMGIVPHAAPANPKFVTVEARLNTFSGWPPGIRQQPLELAEAGFFHIGSGDDKVKCFSCDGGLRNWQPEDDPWIEHATWFSECGFLRMVKGDEFISKCLREKPPEPVLGLKFSADRPAVGDPKLVEEQLEQMMSSPLVNDVVAMGIQSSQIRSALRKKLQTTGTGFKNVLDLSEAATKETSQLCNGGASSSCPKNDECSVNVKKSKGKNWNTASNVKEVQEIKDLDIDLESENQRLKDQRTCKICFDGEIGVVFLPCGHLICCVKCAPSLNECPFCRQTITGTVKTYMS